MTAPDGRHLVEIGHHFDLEMILLEEPGLGLHRLGGIRVEGLVADRRHLALIEEKFDGGE
jgi:hypothetical protein